MTHKPHMTLESGEKLYEGEYGITRDGDLVGPLEVFNNKIYPWMASCYQYTNEGRYGRHTTDRRDIIARADQAISLDTLENLTTPLGLLDDATRKALEAHGGPYEWFVGVSWVETKVLCGDRLTHRVKRQPKVETVTCSLHGDKFIGYFAIDKINGEYDLTTVRPWVEGEE